MSEALTPATATGTASNTALATPGTVVSAQVPDVAGPPHRRLRRKQVLRIIGTIVAVIFGLVWLFPVYWMVNTAFLTTDQIEDPAPNWFPSTPSLRHFSGVLHSHAFWSAMRMSLSIAAIVVIGSVILAFFSGIAISRFRFRFRTSLVVAIIIIQMIPAETIFVSQYRMLDSWDLLNSVVGTSLIYLGTNVPFTIWMLKGFVDGVPVELEEAAMIDGCSRFRAFFSITLPLLGSGLVASTMFAFLASWNEYTLALVLLTKDNAQTLPLWLTSFNGRNQNTDWGGIMAGSTLMALPVVVLFLLIQRNLKAGIVAGSVR